jgi:hypothetical protein
MAAFTIFLYPRMLGCAAEIDDHLNHGRNMDTRTQRRFASSSPKASQRYLKFSVLLRRLPAISYR